MPSVTKKEPNNYLADNPCFFCKKNNRDFYWKKVKKGYYVCSTCWNILNFREHLGFNEND